MSHSTTDGKGMCPHAFEVTSETCFCFDGASYYAGACYEVPSVGRTPGHSFPSWKLGSSRIACYDSWRSSSLDGRSIKITCWIESSSCHRVSIFHLLNSALLQLFVSHPYMIRVSLVCLTARGIGCALLVCMRQAALKSLVSRHWVSMVQLKYLHYPQGNRRC